MCLIKFFRVEKFIDGCFYLRRFLGGGSSCQLDGFFPVQPSR